MNRFGNDSLVSVVIPCFNDERAHIEQAVGSALGQSYPNIEVIVVDDGSTSEATIETLGSLPDGVQLIRSENQGPSAARNLGISISTGEFILPLDADDWISSDFVTAAVKTAADPMVEIAFPEVQEFGAATRLKQPPLLVTLADLAGGNRIAACALFRRARWSELGGYDESMRRGFEDYEWWLRILLNGGVARKTTPAVLNYRQREGSRRLADLAVGDAMSVTRARILTNNPDHLHALMTASWARIDALQIEVQKAWADPLQIRRWLRWVKPLASRARLWRSGRRKPAVRR